MNNETPYKVGTEKDMEVGALNPKVKKLMEEAENKSDQLDIQIVLLSKSYDQTKELFDLHQSRWFAEIKRDEMEDRRQRKETIRGRINFAFSSFAILIALLAFANELKLLDVGSFFISMMDFFRG